MIKIIANLLATVMLLLTACGCSVVVKEGYYSPMVEENFILRSWPSTSCSKTWGDLPDKYADVVDGRYILSIRAKQYDRLYLWGPLWFSIVPVFPITWIVELFVSDDLVIQVYGQEGIFANLSSEDFLVAYETPSGVRVLNASKVNALSEGEDKFTGVLVIFPVDSDKIDAFTFKIMGYRGFNNEKRDVEVPFVKASRWSWLQVPPPC